MSNDVVEPLRAQMLRTCSEREFAIDADVWMPDHLHALIRGQTRDSAFKPMMTLFRQRTAISFRAVRDIDLWQDGYYDHVLRDDESPLSVIEYMILNPVRAQLVEKPADYSFTYLASGYAEYFFKQNPRCSAEL